MNIIIPSKTFIKIMIQNKLTILTFDLLFGLLALLEREIPSVRIAYEVRSHTSPRIALHITFAVTFDFTFEITVAVTVAVCALLCTK